MALWRGPWPQRVAQDAVQNVLRGFNSTIFAYGQTGSGKTYTVTGADDSLAKRGLIPRALQCMFSQACQPRPMLFSGYFETLLDLSMFWFAFFLPEKKRSHLSCFPSHHGRAALNEKNSPEILNANSLYSSTANFEPPLLASLPSVAGPRFSVLRHFMHHLAMPSGSYFLF